MKIAMVAGYFPPHVRGGGELSAELLTRMLRDAGCEISVLTCGDSESDSVINDIRIKRIISPNIYWNYKPCTGSVRKLVWHLKENTNARARLRIREFLKDCAPDLLVTSTIENFGAEAWLAPYQANLPCVHILRSYYPFCWKGSAVRNGQNCDGSCFDCAILSWGRRKASRRVSGVVGISHYILERHLRQGFFPSATTAIIPEPILESSFAQPRENKPSGRFGYLGVLSPDKGLETLAAAWRKADIQDGSLSIAGTGKESYTSRLVGLFEGRAGFEGWVDSSKYLTSIDFLIVPSIWNEPFGRIVIEAFAKGVPVIGSEIAGIGETVRNGQNGFTFSAGDSDELAKLIRRCSVISREEYARVSGQASLDVRAYSSAIVGRAHIQFYKKIISGYHPATSTSESER